jgi:ApaG protein
VSTVTQTTQSIVVSVETTPIEAECKPQDGVFAFAYTVRIENRSENRPENIVQLLERHWLIESAGEQIGEVVGPGVVGVQPILEPGQHFEYTSSTVIKDPVGSMRGAYIFSRRGGGYFTAQIPRFTLIYQQLCN